MRKFLRHVSARANLSTQIVNNSYLELTLRGYNKAQLVKLNSSNRSAYLQFYKNVLYHGRSLYKFFSFSKFLEYFRAVWGIESLGSVLTLLRF